jgi:hypothetical protein
MARGIPWLLALGTALLLLACGEPEALRDERLLGRWRSDKTATLAEIEAIGGFTAQQRRSLKATLGRRTLTYSESRLTTRLEGVGAERELTTSAPYRVVAVQGNEIVVESHDHLLGSSERESVFVEGDRLWIWIADGRWREFYRRVP